MSCDHEHAGLRSSVLPALFCTVPSPQHARPIQACSKTARQHHGTLVWQRWAERLEHNSGSELQSTNCLLLLEAGMPYSVAQGLLPVLTSSLSKAGSAWHFHRQTHYYNISDGLGWICRITHGRNNPIRCGQEYAAIGGWHAVQCCGGLAACAAAASCALP